MLILFLGMTRVIAESGLIAIRAPLSPQDFSMFTLGTTGLAQQGILGILLSFVWVGDTKTTIMPALANTSKLYSSVTGDRRKLLWPKEGLDAWVLGRLDDTGNNEVSSSCVAPKRGYK